VGTLEGVVGGRGCGMADLGGVTTWPRPPALVVAGWCCGRADLGGGAI
jgi:hypothetical protein